MNKLDVSQKLIKDAFNSYERPLISCSFGKDSVTVLYIIKQIYGRVPCPILSNDTGFWFPEIRELMHKLRKDWDLEIINVTRWHPKAKETPPDATWEAEHLKLTPTLWMIDGYGADAVFAGIRNDESDTRKDAKPVEQQKTHTRIHPIIHWTEEDVWTYTRSEKIPYCSLYDKGYRSIDSWPFTKPATGQEERSGRALDKEDMMKKLRAAGYW